MQESWVKEESCNMAREERIWYLTESNKRGENVRNCGREERNADLYWRVESGKEEITAV